MSQVGDDTTPTTRALSELLDPLTGAVAALTDDRFLIIDIVAGPSAGRYVQVIAYGDSFRSERIGDAFLAPEDRPSERDREVLAALGWRPDDACGNLVRTWDPPFTHRTIAALLLATLELVDGAGITDLEVTGDPVAIEAFAVAPY